MQCQRMAISGFSFVGADVGGFIDQPSSELYTRWVQLATFQPFFRTHSSGDHGNQEPWSFGNDTLNIIRKFIELRYQLLPYLYTTFYQYISEFTPMLRPISYYDQYDSDTLYRVDEFLLGDHLLVCPILEPSVENRYVYLPKGRWYDYWNDTVWEGGVEIKAEAPIDRIPLFIREGAVIPMGEVIQYVGERDYEQMTLHVYYGGNNISSLLYEDNGDGYEYEKGIYNKKRFETNSSSESFKLSLRNSGHFEPSYHAYKIILHGLPFEMGQIYINEKKVESQPILSENGTMIVVVEIAIFLSLEVKK